jgi:hypothetical protein
MFNWFSGNNLQAIPNKSQFILYTNNILCKGINIYNIILHPLGSVKLLVVCIDCELNYNDRVTTICRKAGRQLNTLGRLPNVQSIDDKNILIECFILSYFNFGPAVWHYFSTANMKKLSIQKRALRYMYNDYVSSYAKLRGKIISHYCVYTELRRS